MILQDLAAEGAYVVIVSDALEILLFGIYTIFFAFALLILIVYKRPLPVDWSIVSATCVLYATCMAHCSLVTTDRFSVLVSSYPLPTGSDMSELLRGADALLKFAGFLSQLVMTHRCWAAWDHAWPVVVAPAVMSITGFVCGMIGPASLRVPAFQSPFIAPKKLSLDIAFCVLSLVADMLVTALLVYRLRRVSAPARNIQSVSDLVFGLAICIIETGALLAAAQLTLLVFLVLEHPFLLVVESFAAQVYGIAPTMMIMRLGINLLPEGRVRWATTVPEFSTVVVCTTMYSEDLDLDLDEPSPDVVHTRISFPVAAARPRRSVVSAYSQQQLDLKAT
ncbi:hypothetical protein C8Q73DRAFT_435861 [Cubamyces lactineus]|nr:hypothetical protein C8Q73DRAFT_435861 [Cubamyces lactineus]